MRSLVLLVAACASCADEHHGGHCLSVCANDVFIEATTAVTSNAMANAMLRICVGPTVCSDLTIDAALSGTATGTFSANVQIWPGASGNAIVGIRPEISYEDDAWLQDGDVWRVTITAPDNRELFAGSAIATYTETGPDCFGHLCRMAELQLP